MLTLLPVDPDSAVSAAMSISTADMDTQDWLDFIEVSQKFLITYNYNPKRSKIILAMGFDRLVDVLESEIRDYLIFDYATLFSYIRYQDELELSIKEDIGRYLHHAIDRGLTWEELIFDIVIDFTLSPKQMRALKKLDSNYLW
jgi:hypothetical protein